MFCKISAGRISIVAMGWAEKGKGRSSVEKTARSRLKNQPHLSLNFAGLDRACGSLVFYVLVLTSRATFGDADGVCVGGCTAEVDDHFATLEALHGEQVAIGSVDLYDGAHKFFLRLEYKECPMFGAADCDGLVGVVARREGGGSGEHESHYQNCVEKLHRGRSLAETSQTLCHGQKSPNWAGLGWSFIELS